MASSLAYTMCIVLCICSLQSTVLATMNLVVYTHEIRGGPNATLLAAAGTGQGNFSAVGWGSFLTFDNLVTQGPSSSSKALGRFTGFAAATTPAGLGGGILAVDQFRFGSESKYNGSSLTIVGSFLTPAQGPWEVVVVGGTGYFRGYHGYGTSTPYPNTTAAPNFAFKWNIFLSK